MLNEDKKEILSDMLYDRIFGKENPVTRARVLEFHTKMKLIEDLRTPNKDFVRTLNSPIDHLDILPSIINRLGDGCMKLIYIGQLVQISQKTLTEKYGFRRQQIWQIEWALIQKGLTLSSDVSAFWPEQEERN